MTEIKLLPNSEMEIIGEISADIFESYRKEAVRKIGKEIKIDGFREGKVPEDIILKSVEEETVLHKMALLTLQREYPKIIETHKIRAIGRPEITITKMAPTNPLGFRAKIFVLPEIKLPDYKEIAKNVINGKKAEEIKEQEKQRLEVLDKIIEKAEMDLPRILIDGEKLKMLNETKSSLEQVGLKWEDYLTHLNKKEEDLLKDWEQDAIKRVKYGLVINEMAEKEKITVLEEELKPEVDKIMTGHRELDEMQVRLYTYGVIRNQKLFKILER
jgi:FKBP-type peptidyl-prolyl cis-trans isomerase (trigger factor)